MTVSLAKHFLALKTTCAFKECHTLSGLVFTELKIQNRLLLYRDTICTLLSNHIWPLLTDGLWFGVRELLQCNIPLGNPASWHSCWCQLTQTIRPNTLADQAHAHGISKPHWHWSTIWTVCAATPQRLLRNSLREMTKRWRFPPGRENAPNPYLIRLHYHPLRAVGIKGFSFSETMFGWVYRSKNIYINTRTRIIWITFFLNVNNSCMAIYHS